MPTARRSTKVADGLASFAEQLANRVIKPLDMVLLSRERIQETLDEAADRGRITRTDANELAAELFRRGRLQTDSLLADLERLLGRGRQQLGSARKRARQPVERLVRAGSRGRAEPSLAITDYDELTAGQITKQLGSLRPTELRKLRDYERRHANRKSVLAAVDKSLG